MPPTRNTEEAEVEQFSEDLQDLLELIPKKDVLFIIGDWNAKLGSQERPGVNRQIWPWSTNEEVKGYTKRKHWSWQTPTSNNTREDSTHGHHQIVNTEIKLIIFCAAKDGEALYS